VYPDGSPEQDLPAPTRPSATKWRWTWYPEQFWPGGTGFVKTTCTYLGVTRRDDWPMTVVHNPLYPTDPPITPAPGFNVVGLMSPGEVSPGGTLTFTGSVSIFPEGTPIDLACAFTLKWPDGDQVASEPHVTTRNFELSLTIALDAPLGQYRYETLCVDTAGESSAGWGYFTVQ